MTKATITYPRIASRAEWLAARKALLAQEKALARRRDAVSAERRRLPMVRVETAYAFEGPRGKASLLDLFEGRRRAAADGPFMSWVRRHDKYEKPSKTAHACCASAAHSA